jgi:PTS system cellobiose-specific IIC component
VKIQKSFQTDGPGGKLYLVPTPIGISGFLATGNAWQGAVLQIFNLLVVMAIWWPFLKIIDKSYYEKENKPSE